MATAIVLNGNPREVPTGSTLEEVLRELGLAGTGVAVGRNDEVVPRSKYGEILVAPGDRIEIVHFVAGG